MKHCVTAILEGTWLPCVLFAAASLALRCSQHGPLPGWPLRASCGMLGRSSAGAPAAAHAATPELEHLWCGELVCHASLLSLILVAVLTRACAD
jgi:hypothetical protein